MPTHFFRYDFFRVQMPKGAPRPFEELIRDVLANEDASLRNLTKGDVTVRLDAGRVTAGTTLGHIISIRMEGLPLRASLAGNTSELELEEDEGIGDGTAFLYDHTLQSLVVQRGRNAVRPAGVVGYFQAKSESDDIELHPILRPDAYARMTSLKTVRRMEIGVAGTSDLSFLKDQNLSINRVFELGDYFKAPRINITMSMGHQREGGLSITNVLAALKAWSKASAETPAVERFTIKGADEDEQVDVIDLISDRLRHVEKVDVTGRTVTFEERAAAIQRAWLAKKTEVSTVLSG